MSYTYFLFSSQPIDADSFIKSMAAVGVNYCDLDKDTGRCESSYTNDDYGTVEINLAGKEALWDAVLDHHVDDIISRLGGNPQSKITMTPYSVGQPEILIIDYLSKLAGHFDFIVTDFDTIWANGKDIKEMKRLGWDSLSGEMD